MWGPSPPFLRAPAVLAALCPALLLGFLQELVQSEGQADVVPPDLHAGHMAVCTRHTQDGTWVWGARCWRRRQAASWGPAAGRSTPTQQSYPQRGGGCGPAPCRAGTAQRWAAAAACRTPTRGAAWQAGATCVRSTCGGLTVRPGWAAASVNPTNTQPGAQPQRSGCRPLQAAPHLLASTLPKRSRSVVYFRDSSAKTGSRWMQGGAQGA